MAINTRYTTIPNNHQTLSAVLANPRHTQGNPSGNVPHATSDAQPAMDDWSYLNRPSLCQVSLSDHASINQLREIIQQDIDKRHRGTYQLLPQISSSKIYVRDLRDGTTLVADTHKPGVLVASTAPSGGLGIITLGCTAFGKCNVIEYEVSVDNMTIEEIKNALNVIGISTSSWYSSYTGLGRDLLKLFEGRSIPALSNAVPVSWINGLYYSKGVEIAYVCKAKDKNWNAIASYPTTKEEALQIIDGLAPKPATSQPQKVCDVSDGIITYGKDINAMSMGELQESLNMIGISTGTLYSYYAQLARDLLRMFEGRRVPNLANKVPITWINGLYRLKGVEIAYISKAKDRNWNSIPYYPGTKEKALELLERIAPKPEYSPQRLTETLEHLQSAGIKNYDTGNPDKEYHRLADSIASLASKTGNDFAAHFSHQDIDFNAIYLYRARGYSLIVSATLAHSLTNSLNLSRGTTAGVINCNTSIETMTESQLRSSLEEAGISTSYWNSAYTDLGRKLLSLLRGRYRHNLARKVPIHWIYDYGSWLHTGAEVKFINKLRDVNNWPAAISHYVTTSEQARQMMDTVCPEAVHIPDTAVLEKLLQTCTSITGGSQALNSVTGDKEVMENFINKNKAIYVNLFTFGVTVNDLVKAWQLSGKRIDVYMNDLITTFEEARSLIIAGYHKVPLKAAYAPWEADAIKRIKSNITKARTIQMDWPTIEYLYSKRSDTSSIDTFFNRYVLQGKTFDDYVAGTFGILCDVHSSKANEFLDRFIDQKAEIHYDLSNTTASPVKISDILFYYDQAFSYQDQSGTYRVNAKTAYLLANLQAKKKTPLNQNGRVADVIYFCKHTDYTFPQIFPLKDISIKPSAFFSYTSSSDLDTLPDTWINTTDTIAHRASDLALPTSTVCKGTYWLPLWKYGAKGTDDKPPVVLLHGLFSNHTYFRPTTVCDRGVPSQNIPAPEDIRINLNDERYSLKNYLQNRGRTVWIGELRGSSKYSLFSLYLGLAKSAIAGKIPPDIPGLYLELLTTDNHDRAAEIHNQLSSGWSGGEDYVTPAGKEFARVKREFEYNVDDHIHEDFPAIIAAACNKSGQEQVQVVGHSLGGIVTVGALPQEFVSKGKSNAGQLESGQTVVLPANAIRSVITLGSGFTFNEVPQEVKDLEDTIKDVSPIVFGKKLDNSALLIAAAVNQFVGPNIPRSLLSPKSALNYIEHQGVQGSGILTQLAFWPGKDMHYFSAGVNEPSYIDQYKGVPVKALGPDGCNKTFAGYPVDIPVSFVIAEDDGVGHIQNVRPLLRTMNINHGEITDSRLIYSYPELFETDDEGHSYFTRTVTKAIQDSLGLTMLPEGSTLDMNTIRLYNDSALSAAWQEATAEEDSIIKRYNYPPYYRALYNNSGTPAAYETDEKGKLKQIHGFSHGIMARGIIDKNAWEDLDFDGTPLNADSIDEQALAKSLFFGFDEKSAPNYYGGQYDMSGDNEPSFPFIKRRLEEQLNE